MKRFLILIAILQCALNVSATKYSCRFSSKPISDALSEFAAKYPDVRITFLYKELDKYTTSADINTDNPLTAVKKIVGLNPIMVMEKNGHILVEALQKGKMTFRGRVIGESHEPVSYATVMLLSPRDSTVVTYGITGENGLFSIPCDRRDVIAKISSVGYRTAYHRCHDTAVGDIIVKTLPVALKNITVRPDETILYPDRTVFVPQQRQKNSSMSGTELLERMAIPQIRVNPRNQVVETAAGKPLKLYIDYVPATANDLASMNVQDVKRVEYLEYPSDPRFEGNPYVVNYIMTQYEYGGYVRAFTNMNFIMNSGQANVTARLQYKRMTYDIMGMGFGFNGKHEGNNDTEVFRLPMADGSIKEIERKSSTASSDILRIQSFATFKASYRSDNLTFHNTVTAGITRVPHNDSYGLVRYTPSDYPDSDFTQNNDNSQKIINYNGYFFLSLPWESSLTFSPSYSFTHTEQNTTYTEEGFSPIINNAYDNTNVLSGRLSFSRKFGKINSVNAFINSSYEYNRTGYSGSTNAFDKTKSSQLSAGVSYSLNTDKFYADLSFGWSWDRLRINEELNNESSPSASLSVQYLINDRHKLGASADYHTWAPAPSYKSENIIIANHLLSYTGNPTLVPTKTTNIGLDYSWNATKNFSLAAYASIWMVNNRYVYNYEPVGGGILRTICQPLGNYAIGLIGVSASWSLLDGNLRLRGGVNQRYAHNGAPYDYTRWPVDFNLSATYYLKNFYFNGYYSSAERYSDGFMVGGWMEYKDRYGVSAGWANQKWNLRVRADNFARWSYDNNRIWFTSRYYDKSSATTSCEGHAMFSVTATFTFGYGKKVKSNDEPRGNARGSSAILSK